MKRGTSPLLNAERLDKDEYGSFETEKIEWKYQQPE
jgi:hypothetical protein